MNSYEFVTHWEVGVGADAVWEAFDELLVADDVMPWWPAVRCTPGDDGDLTLAVRSPLGPRLRVRLYELVEDRPRALDFRADGDLVGAGRLDVESRSVDLTVLTIHWNVATTGRWMNRLAPVLRPAFTGAHRFVMWRGGKRLDAWLRAR